MLVNITSPTCYCEMFNRIVVEQEGNLILMEFTRHGFPDEILTPNVWVFHSVLVTDHSLQYLPG